MEYCGNCDELHSEQDCKVYMFREKKCDSDKVFIDCDLCDTPDEMYKIDYIHEMNICTFCSEIVHEDMSENDKIEGECPVCLEHTQLNMLPCKHHLCFDCCKHIYFGVTDIKRPMHYVELDEPEWPYVNAHLETIYKEFLKEHKLYHHDTLEEFEKHHISSFGKRPQWMRDEAFIDYEYEVMQYILLHKKLDKGWYEWVETKKVGNRTCPLCRASP